MSQYDTPNEIYGKISVYLTKADLIQASLVSKAWHAAYVRTIFRSIVINTRSQVRRFFEQLKQSQECGNSFGNAIRQLTIDDRIEIIKGNVVVDRRKTGLSSDEFIKLQMFCPHLEKLDFLSRVWDHVSIRYTILTYLTLEGEIVEKIEQQHTMWQTIFSKLPLLRYLDIRGSMLASLSFTRPTELNLQKIHRHCPRLKSLHPQHQSWYYPGWIRYIATTFSRLQILDMECLWDADLFRLNDPTSFHDAYNSIGKNCHQLHSLYLRQVDEHIITPLKQACPQLTALELDGQSSSALIPEQSFDLHLILEEFPNLLTLTLRHADLRGHGTDHSSDVRYPLVNFSLFNSMFSDSLFTAMSTECPALKNVSLTDCSIVNGYKLTEMCIDLDDHDLDTFNAVGIHSVLVGAFGGYQPILDTAIFGLRCRPYNNKKADRVAKWQEEHEVFDYDTILDIEHGARFYHMCEINGDRLRRMESHEATAAVRYIAPSDAQRLELYDDPEFTDDYGFFEEDDNNVDDNERLTYNLPKDWQLDLRSGFLLLSCRSVRKVLFGFSGKLEFR
ncbi:hypothetical protein BDA99DRAFT_562250 [Phascolomyces articulosus]|uniref:F-box domain-containing protein n=1 Tax=Phascolomyces articulosus TaxID=60185 RepID=A0AAD5JVK3_9FUNG|nr:hypothetical protein BDA99DRAFT_562250 [Phascolomyces articulosus]